MTHADGNSVSDVRVQPRPMLPLPSTASVGITLPVFSGKKAALDESSSRREASAQAQETTRQTVQLRAGERHAVLDGLLRTAHCLDPAEVLSPGQAAGIDRLHVSYPELVDDAFVRANLERWRD
jgi:hypothetical protein